MRIEIDVVRARRIQSEGALGLADVVSAHCLGAKLKDELRAIVDLERLTLSLQGKSISTQRIQKSLQLAHDGFFLVLTPSLVHVQLVQGEIFLEDPMAMLRPLTLHWVTSSLQWLRSRSEIE